MKFTCKFIAAVAMSSSVLCQAQELRDYSNSELLNEIRERLELASTPVPATNVGYACDNNDLIIKTHSVTNGAAEFVVDGVPNIGSFSEFCDKQKAKLASITQIETATLLKVCTSQGNDTIKEGSVESISVLPDGSVAQVQKDIVSRLLNPSNAEFTAALNDCLERVL